MIRIPMMLQPYGDPDKEKNIGTVLIWNTGETSPALGRPMYGYIISNPQSVYSDAYCVHGLIVVKTRKQSTPELLAAVMEDFGVGSQDIKEAGPDTMFVYDRAIGRGEIEA